MLLKKQVASDVNAVFGGLVQGVKMMQMSAQLSLVFMLTVVPIRQETTLVTVFQAGVDTTVIRTLMTALGSHAAMKAHVLIWLLASTVPVNLASLEKCVKQKLMSVSQILVNMERNVRI